MKQAKRIELVAGAVVVALTLVANAAVPGVGEIIRSSNASINGVAVPEQGTLTPGAFLRTAKDGSALVQFSTGSQINLSGNTSLRFRTDSDRLTAEMSAGTLGAKSLGKDPLAVETPDYQIAPAVQTAIYVVAMLPDQTTIVSARQGSVSIVQRSSREKYVLAEGHYARVANGANGGRPVPSPGTPNQQGGPPPALLRSTGKLFVIAVGAGVGVAVILDETVLQPSGVSPSAP